MNRRKFGHLVAGGAAALTGGATLIPDRSAGQPTRARYRVDGNLIPPIDEDDPLPEMIAAQVRSTGLTAIKMTVGGSGSLNRAATEAELAVFKRSLALNPDLFLQVRSLADLDVAAASGRLGVIFSFEAAEMLEGVVENIDRFRAAGVLVMGLTYNKQTPFGSGVLVESSTGLTMAGHSAVDRMNASGVTIDLSHSDERTSRDALRTSRKPVLITHAGCAAVHPHVRNKSDLLLRELADRGGVIGIYQLSFLANPDHQPHLEEYLAHVVHALKVCGEDHVGIGTDGYVLPADTSPAFMHLQAVENERRRRSGVAAPGEGLLNFVLGLDGPNRYAVIADAIRRRGYPARVIDKVLGGNFVRAFEETWIKA